MARFRASSPSGYCGRSGKKKKGKKGLKGSRLWSASVREKRGTKSEEKEEGTGSRRQSIPAPSMAKILDR